MHLLGLFVGSRFWSACHSLLLFTPSPAVDAFNAALSVSLFLRIDVVIAALSFESVL